MSIDFAALVVGPLQTNCYIIWDTQTSKAAIIDPGGSRELITSTVAERGLTVEYILLTHGHPDHGFYAGGLAKEYSAQIGMHESDICQLTDGLPLAELLYDVSEYIDFRPSVLLNDGDVIHIGDSPIEVLHTPGHSEGGLCFVTDAGIFCGDTIFASSIGRTDFPGGSYGQLIASINTKLLVLKDITPLYPGHGPSTTVGQERSTNPFLR